MKILFIIDPLPLLKAYKDTSVAMMQALASRGHSLWVAEQGDLYLDDGQVMSVSTPIELLDGAGLHQANWWTQGEPEQVALSQFGAVLMRKDPPFDMEYVYATHLLERAQAEGAQVFNSGAAIRNHPEKLAIAEFPQYTAPTLVSRTITRIKAFCELHGDVIVKPLDGMGGTGIFRIRQGDP